MASTNLNVNIGANIKGLRAGMNKANSTLNKFKKTAIKTGGIIAGAFAARELAMFTKEAFKLSEQFIGIERGFQSIANAPVLLESRWLHRPCGRGASARRQAER